MGDDLRESRQPASTFGTLMPVEAPKGEWARPLFGTGVSGEHGHVGKTRHISHQSKLKPKPTCTVRPVPANGPSGTAEDILPKEAGISSFVPGGMKLV